MDSGKVFLVSGQVLQQIGGAQTLSSLIEQRVVVARDDQQAYEVLSSEEPAFQPLGHASLVQLEESVSKVRAVLRGESADWKLYVSEDIA